MKNWSLKWQIIALVVSVVTVVVTALTVLTVTQIERQLTESLEREAVNLCSLLADNAGVGLVFQDSSYVADIARSALTNSDVIGFSLYDREGRIFFEQSSVPGVFPPYDSCNKVTETEITHSDDRLTIERAVNSRDKLVGCLWLVLTKKPLNAEVRAGMTIVFTMAALLIALSAVIGIVMSRRVVKPIRTFEQAALRISSGDMLSSIDSTVLHRDFVQLGTSFNQMQDALQHAFHELNKSRDQLEDHVEVRTSELRDELSERRRAEAALREGQALLRATLESTADGILVVNSEGKVTNGNARFAEMWRIPSALLATGDDNKLLAHVLDQLIDPDAFVAKVKQLYASRDESMDTLSFKDGRVFERFSCPLLQDNVVAGRVWSFRDITERKQAEEEAQKLASVVRYSQELVNLANVDGRMTFLNEAGSRMLGIDPEDVKQTNIMQVIPNHLKAKVETELLPALMTSGVWTGELQYRNLRTGELTDVYAQTFTIMDASGKSPQYLANVSLNITERRRAEQAQAALLKVSEMASQTQNLETLLRTVQQQLGTLIDIRDFYVALYDTVTGLYSFPYSQDEHTDEAFSLQSLEVGLIDYVRRTGEPSHVDDWLGVPLQTMAGTIGVLAIQHNHDQDVYDQSDVDLLRSMADQIARVIERVRATENLRFTQFSVDHSADPAFWMTEDAHLFYVNEAACRALGYGRKELLSMTMHDLDPNFPVEAWSVHWHELKEKGSLTFQSSHRRKNGQEFPIELTSNYVEFEGEEYNCAFARDITERRRTDQAQAALLKVSEMASQTENLESLLETVQQQFGTLIDTRNFYVALFDPETGLYSFPYSRDEHDDEDFSPQSLEGSLTDYVRRLGEPLLVDEATQRALAAAGKADVIGTPSPIWLGVPLRTAAGTIGVLVVQNYHDKDAYNQSDVVLLMSLADPIARVIERVRAEEQHRKLQEELERAERMRSLGVLAGGVAHDLNNMLGPLVGYPELILMRLPEDSPIRKQVQRIGNAAKDAADVVQDLLTLARRGRYDMAPTNLNTVLEAYFDSPGFAKLSETRSNVTVTRDLNDNIGLIMGSTPHLSKVFMNLILNAFDAMPDGGEIRITTTQQNVRALPSGYQGIIPGEYVTLSIKDTGTGIDPADIEKIFEPYFSKKKMGTSGSGLGLSVVYGVVKDHKGYYDILSEIGKGTEFILYFPLTETTAKVLHRSNQDLRGCETVLVVDDDNSQREMATELLTSLGYRVISAANGREALDCLRTQPVDIVMLDMIMEKDFDGLDTYREILKIRPAQKAIVVSGFSSTERVQEVQRLGAGQYVKKPYTIEALASALRAELDRTEITTVFQATAPIDR